jgi:thymidylate synthase (FAD)
VIFKTLSELRCELVAHTVMVAGDAEFMPASAARASFGREDKTGDDPAADRKLMRYLSEHHHTSPFEHQSATFLVEAPLYVAREWMRHRTQSFNEISMRYTSSPADTFYLPEKFRRQASRNKQCSEGELSPTADHAASIHYQDACMAALDSYRSMLAIGVSRELARGVLGTAMVTRFFATANLLNWWRWYQLRSAENAQPEIQHYARAIWSDLSGLWPAACAAIGGE